MTIALLQSFLHDLMRPDLIWVLIPLSAIGLGGLAIVFDIFKDLLSRRDRIEARKMYERIAIEKLDVIKTAVAMGYEKDEVAELDSRLAQLIGQDQLNKLLGKKTPGVPMISQELDDPGTDAGRVRPSQRSK